MKTLLPLLLLLASAGTTHVKVTATYLPPTAGKDATIAVQFSPVDPQVRVNEEPAPRLKLDPAQQVLADKPAPRKVLADKPAPRKAPRPDPGTTRYLDPAVPVAFPVTVGDGAPRGEHTVKGTVTYFYCSKVEGWCRKGSAEIAVPVRVP